MRNATLVGLGVASAVATLELLYTALRQPFINSGQDWPRADPRFIAYAGAAGFTFSLIRGVRCP
jgi:hypothetical protein